MKKILFFIIYRLIYLFNPAYAMEDNFTERLLQEIIAEKYDVTSDPNFQVQKKLVKENVPHLHKLTRLLHLNCNDGKLSAYFAAELDKRIVIGMDYSKKSIEHAQNAYSELYKNLHFQETIFDNSSFSNKFQLVFSIGGLQGTPRCQKILRSTYNALCPRGMLFIATASKDTEGLIMQTVWQVLGAAHWQPYQETLSTILKSSLTQETLEKKLKKANFININIETRAAAINEKSLTRYIGRISSGLALPEELQTQLTTEIVTAYLKKTFKMKDRSLIDQIPIYIVKAYKEPIA